MERRPEQVGSVQYATSACVNQYSFPVSWRLKNLPPVFPHSHKKRTLISGSFCFMWFFLLHCWWQKYSRAFTVRILISPFLLDRKHLAYFILQELKSPVIMAENNLESPHLLAFPAVHMI